METQDHAQGKALGAIEVSVYLALEHYANVHRGSGHASLISTRLYEHARRIVLRHLGLGDDHVVIFCTPWRLELLRARLPARARPRVVSSADLGLPVGVRALAVRRSELPKGVPAQPGGGTIRMVSEGSVDWAGVPERFEPGTPNLLGVVALARALELGRPARGHRGPRPEPSGLGEPPPSDALAHLSERPLLAALRETLIGREVLVPTAAGARRAINFDHGASAPTFEPIWQAVRHAWRQDEAGQQAIVRRTRALAHRFFGAPARDYDVVFAANTTEAIALAAAGLHGTMGSVVLNTAFEHNSNELPWRYLPGVTLAHLPASPEGFIELAHLEGVLRAYNHEHLYGERRIGLVSLCGASNVLGSCNDLAAIATVVHRYGAKLLVDAAQLAPHRRIRMAADGIDLLAFSAHKMYAPFGSGGLIAAKGLLALDPTEAGLAAASGEENLAGIAALGKAMELLARIGMDEVEREEQALTRYALTRLAAVPGLKLYGLADPDDPRFPRRSGVIAFELAGVPHNLLARRLAEVGGIATRSGCFCVNVFVKHLLGIGRMENGIARAGLALLPRTMERMLAGLVRVSFGLTNRTSEIDRLVETLLAIAREHRSPAVRALARHHLGTPVVPFTATRKRINRLVERKLRQVF